jgi:predicted acetyltransferase
MLSPVRATDFEFRAVTDDELRATDAVFHEALHSEPPNDEKWATLRRIHEPGRTFGAFVGETVVGSATSLTSDLTVPGGAVVPLAAVTGVGVRSDYRRRGALTGLMRTQLASAAASGEVLATLHASEATIYERFGYGLSTLAKTIRVRPARARLRPEAPSGGTVRFLTKDEALRLLPEAYQRLRGDRVGMMGRSTPWWTLNYESRMAHGYYRVAAHFDRDERVDGMIGYRPVEIKSDDPRTGSGIDVLDFVGANQVVENDLWRFVLGIDLVEQVTVYMRPSDDPVGVLLGDFFAIRSDQDDELWLRVIDAQAALSARTYGHAEPVVIEVVDPLLPDNSGRYLIGQHGSERTTEPAAITMGVEILGMIYLGTWRPSTLAGIGRLTVHDPAALPAADRLFATERPAWCGSLF